MWKNEIASPSWVIIICARRHAFGSQAENPPFVIKFDTDWWNALENNKQCQTTQCRYLSIGSASCNNGSSAIFALSKQARRFDRYRCGTLAACARFIQFMPHFTLLLDVTDSAANIFAMLFQHLASNASINPIPNGICDKRLYTRLKRKYAISNSCRLASNCWFGCLLTIMSLLRCCQHFSHATAHHAPIKLFTLHSSINLYSLFIARRQWLCAANINKATTQWHGSTNIRASIKSNCDEIAHGEQRRILLKSMFDKQTKKTVYAFRRKSWRATRPQRVDQHWHAIAARWMCASNLCNAQVSGELYGDLCVKSASKNETHIKAVKE